jgi:hypothetical protein
MADSDSGMSCDNNNEMEFDFELTSAWDIYFSRNDKENWDERLVYVGTFKTVKGMDKKPFLS